MQQRASLPEATAADQRRARSQARDWGRFTRNFVVQGTAAEWALCWLADLRRRLRALGDVDGVRPRARLLPARRGDRRDPGRAGRARRGGRPGGGPPRRRAAVRPLPRRVRPGRRRACRATRRRGERARARRAPAAAGYRAAGRRRPARAQRGRRARSAATAGAGSTAGSTAPRPRAPWRPAATRPRGCSSPTRRRRGRPATGPAPSACRRPTGPGGLPPGPDRESATGVARSGPERGRGRG